MGVKRFKAYTPSRRNMTVSAFDENNKKDTRKIFISKEKMKKQEETHMEELLLDIKVEETDKNIE